MYGLGFLGQAFFGARLIVQLYLSEKSGEVLSPVAFWILSLIASILFLFYGFLRSDIIIIVGQTISFYIYVRNLALNNFWNKLPFVVRISIILSPVIVILPFFVLSAPLKSDIVNGDIWRSPVMIIGAIGQLALNLRFVYQWWFSERVGSSVLPIGFWYISIVSSILVIVYALFHPIHKIEPVLLVSQVLGIIAYIRNVMIYQRQQPKTITRY